MKALLDLAAGWRKDADLLRNHGASEAAATTELHAQQVLDAVAQAEDEELSLAESASASGYSKRRLSELLADGTIPNAGRTGAPRIKRKHLPMRANSKKRSDFDASSEARAILGGTGGPA